MGQTLMAFRCGRKTEASKGLKISKPPNILTLHIKRFTVAFGSGGSLEMRKNPTRVIFPERLDITPYTLNPQVSQFEPQLSTKG